MLSRLFRRKPKLTDADASRRREAVLALDPSEEAAFLRVARDDPDPAVRAAAIGRIASAEALGAMLDEPPPPGGGDQVAAIADRLAELGSDHPFARHPQVLVARFRQQPDAQSLEAIADPEQAARALLAVQDLDTRTTLAQAIHDEARLTSLEHFTRTRDKAVHRIARDRLAELKRLRQERDELVKRAESLLASADRVRPDDAQLAAKCDVLRREWDTILAGLERNAAALEPFHHPGAPVEALRARFHLPELAVAAGPPSGEDGLALRSFESLLSDLTALDHRITADPGAFEQTDDLTTRLRELQARWSEHADREPPSDAEARVFRDRYHRVHELIEALERANRTRAGAAPLLTADTGFKAPETDEDYATVWRVQAESRRNAGQAAELLAGVEWPEDYRTPALDGRAGRPRDGTARPGRTLSRDLLRGPDGDRQRDRGDGAGGRGRRGERGLAHAGRGEPMDPPPPPFRAGRTGRAARQPLGAPARAHRLAVVRRARQAGGAVRGDRSHRGAPAGARRADGAHQGTPRPRPGPGPPALRHRPGADGPLQRRGRARLRALPPHFAALAEERRFNLEQREVICGELETFVAENDWEHTDYRGVEQILRQARTEWRNYHPVDRSPGKKLDARFKAVTDAIYGHLKVEWDRNVAAKQAIVEEARGAVESGAPLPDQINLMKRLQADWKRVGTTPRRVDQQLWKDFRGICDDVFQARDVERDERRTRTTVAVTDANALIEELEQEAAADTTEVMDARQLADYRRRAEALPRLPGEIDRRLRRALSDVEREVRLRRNRKPILEKLAYIEQVATLDAELATLEREADATADWERRAESMRSLFAARLDAETPEADEEALRRATVEAEVGAGVESPESEQPLRLEVQMERLQAGMGARERAGVDVDGLLERWCRHAAGLDGGSDLRARFFAALRQVVDG